jgi:hypothetical protein
MLLVGPYYTNISRRTVHRMSDLINQYKERDLILLLTILLQLNFLKLFFD